MSPPSLPGNPKLKCSEVKRERKIISSFNEFLRLLTTLLVNMEIEMPNFNNLAASSILVCNMYICHVHICYRHIFFIYTDALNYTATQRYNNHVTFIRWLQNFGYRFYNKLFLQYNRQNRHPVTYI